MQQFEDAHITPGLEEKTGKTKENEITLNAYFFAHLHSYAFILTLNSEKTFNFFMANWVSGIPFATYY